MGEPRSQEVLVVEKEPTHYGNFMEDMYGFAQAVRVGDTVYVSGQTAFNDDFTIAGGDDMAGQMRAAYANIARVLEPYGAGIENIVDETLFVTDYMAAAGVALEVRKEVYGGSFDVCSTLCEVSALGPGLLIEIKCTARL
jgi:enamine deaminase RidA (YjgF/YER057c/UK114 family)